MNNITSADKLIIAEVNLKRLCGSIYEAEIQHRAHNTVGDKEIAQQIVQRLQQLEKMKDVYIEIINELKNVEK